MRNFPEANSHIISNVGSQFAAASNSQAPVNAQFPLPNRKWFRLKPGRFVDEEDSFTQSEENHAYLVDDEDDNSSTTGTFVGVDHTTTSRSSNDDHLFSIG